MANEIEEVPIKTEEELKEHEFQKHKALNEALYKHPIEEPKVGTIDYFFKEKPKRLPTFGSTLNTVPNL